MNTETTLDDNWINEFDATDQLYKDFYKDNLYYVNLTIIYINCKNEMDKIKQEPLLLSKQNEVLYEEIFALLKKNSIDNDKRYSLLSILKYNFNIEPDDLNMYLYSDYNNNYLSVITHIDNIVFQKTINMFHDLNDLIFIFYEKSNNKLHSNTHNNTKRIYLNNNSHNKTIKKQYKE